MPCAGDAQQMCGGPGSNSIYLDISDYFLFKQLWNVFLKNVLIIFFFKKRHTDKYKNYEKCLKIAPIIFIKNKYL